MAASRIMVARRGSRPTTAMLRLPSTNYAYINTPIRRLPNELLMEVFRIDYCACKRTNYCDPRRDSTCQWTYETVSTEWLRLLLVCRHWHTIACATAALWRSISASRKVRWLKLCLARSADMTVDVVLAWPRWSDRVLKAIVAKASHIRKLVIVVHEHDVSDDIDQLWRLQMPFLEELTFHAVVSADGFWPSVTCADFDSTAFPALRSLRLSNATFSLACPIVSQLHTLQLIYASTIKCWETEKVLQALEAIAQDGTLRHLELNRSYLPRERLAHIHPISLLKLESLVLIGYEHQHISNLLRHLHLGPDARIHLTLDSNLEAEWSEDQWLGLIDLIPPEDMQDMSRNEGSWSLSAQRAKVVAGDSRFSARSSPTLVMV
ncbi:hypothetical protein L226DRAFT_562768 [Lentinus tigrinus ALCF2SS1-7]|uniref:F-box domain-containing protein n=1 Tax=Lentinus tigrinus ALCF2SS1-6 TaxID=1328759 RepID=A0A5C2RS03_9APHY|nr:hypothetical protein L227DRAFT_641903 [Lentinus tigrinus ALCF2SS1-6]RPD70605.1 hypothetical protein L226DRAFT_562768 [Lentinus tigrinus ALCF2SS1-7]